MKNLIIILFIASGFSSCVASYIGREVTNGLNESSASRAEQSRTVGRSEPGMPIKKGSCFAKCLIENQYELQSEEIPVYSGITISDDIALDTVELLVKAETIAWAKKKADKNCLSANPEDCLVWCLIQVPEETKTYVIVRDTSATDQFEMLTHESSILVQEGGFTEWKEVVCDGKVTKEMLGEMQSFLIDNGYLESDQSISDSEIKKALVIYQKDNQLPVGQMDLETLDFMGISY